ncbi:MAG: DoxX family protein [Bacteroidota bacterium]
MFLVLKKLTLPYSFEQWHLSLIATLPKIIGGFFLTFYYSAHNMGVPWESDFNNLVPFEISPKFVGHVQDFGFIFSKYPTFFAKAMAFSMFFGGICLILGFFTRIASSLIFWAMLMTLLFREYDYTWSYIPIFTFLSVSILGLWFGSGRFGLDYLIAKKMNWL